MRASKLVGALLALIALAAFWREEPEVFNHTLVFNLGSADQPHPISVPLGLLAAAPFVLRFALPLILKGALLLPFAATALTRQAARRGTTFDPARDLSGDSIAPGSREEAAVDTAIAAALEARNHARPTGDLAQTPSHPYGRRDAAA